MRKIRTSFRGHVATAQVARWLTGFGIVGLSTDKPKRKITGLSGVEITVGSLRSAAGPLTHLTDGDTRTVRLRVLPAEAGAAIDDSLVVVRLDQFAPMFEAWIETNRHRLYGEE